jgi:uncharacterized protein (TIGR03435 family)
MTGWLVYSYIEDFGFTGDLMQRLKSLCAATVLFFACALFAQQSQWVHPSANGHLIYGRDKNGVTIPDYSFAGYRSGGVALPTVPAQINIVPTGADDTADIQHAIDTVSARPLDANGFRGAVQLAPGVFHCSAALTIAASGVVLRGAGSGADHEATTINLIGDPHVGIIIKGNFALNTISSATNITDAFVPFGAHTVHVTDTTHIHVGDLVQISKPVTAAWIKYMGMSDLERSDREEHWINGILNVRRRVTAVSGHAVTLQIALMDSYDSKFLGTEHFTVQPVEVFGQVKKVGVEDLRIVAPAVSVGFHDAHTIAMEINAAADSWVRNVAMIDTTEGVRMDFNSERVTLTLINVEQRKTVTSSARPFHFAINGTQVLVDRATGTGDKVTYFATEPRQQGPVVILNSIFHGDGNLEPHQRWSTGLLVDNCAVPDGGIHLINRGIMGSGHGWTIGWGVVWNSIASDFIIQQAPGTITWAMGNRGPLESQGMPDDKGGRRNGIPLPSGIIESQGKPVSPQSLYLSQLAERLGPDALKNIGYSTTDPVLERPKADPAWAIPEPPKHMLANANPAFKVVTIKPGERGHQGRTVEFRESHFRFTNFSVNDLISFAYDLNTAQIIGAPSWLATDLYDIEGVPDIGGIPSEKQQSIMLQKLLADRFQLEIHHERKELPVYVMTVARGGPKITKDANSADGPTDFYFGDFGDLTVRNLTMADFASWFQRSVTNKPVVDHTKLTDHYDFTLKWTPDDSQFVQFRGSSPLPLPSNNASPDLSTAFKEQLGLKFEATEVSEDVIVIDHIEKPSPLPR